MQATFGILSLRQRTIRGGPCRTMGLRRIFPARHFQPRRATPLVHSRFCRISLRALLFVRSISLSTVERLQALEHGPTSSHDPGGLIADATGRGFRDRFWTRPDSPQDRLTWISPRRLFLIAPQSPDSA